MRIGPVDLENEVLVVAEIGNNHEGNFAVAQALVRAAADSGVHAVKFQTFQTAHFVSSSDKARFDRLSSFELSRPQFRELERLARSLGLLFISTPLDLGSAVFLEDLVDCYKIASGDNNFYALIEQVARTGKPVIISSGLSDLEQIRSSKQFLERQWQQLGIAGALAVLHCVSSYPLPPEQANLAAIPLLVQQLGCTVGYSDHTVGVEAAVVAVALGARIIEKHFTLDKNYSDFRDHQLSANPDEMQQLVERVRQAQVLLGKAEKAVQPSEVATAAVARRSIAAAADLSCGHRLEWKDLTWIRPARGVPPGEEDKVLGKVLKRAVAFGELILPENLD